MLLLACARPHPRVVFVGLDGADWQLLDRFMSDGTMPNLAALVREGDRRVLLTQHPPLSPLVWTSMMTGRSPLEHRILDFTRFNPTTHEKEPITSDERRVPAIWNMASANGQHVDVFGLWATYPAEEVNGVLVSDRLFSFQYDALPPAGAVFPPAREAWARGVVADVASHTGAAAMRHYVPSLTDEQYARVAANRNPFDDPVTALRRIVIETEVMHRLAMERIADDKPELGIVYFQGTDAIGHLFVRSDIQYANVPRVYFARIDQLLGDYRDLARKLGATLVIASDHGFRWNGGDLLPDPSAPGTAGQWHRDEGVFLQWPTKQRRAGTLHVVDVFNILRELGGVPDNPRAAHKAPIVASTSRDAEGVAKLQALGYIGAGEPARGGGSSTRTAGSFNNEGLILRENGRDAEAIAAFENALHVDSKNASAMWNLSDLLHRQHKDAARADALLDAAIAAEPQPRWLVMRGRYRLEKNDCANALSDFRRVEPRAMGDAILFASIGAAELCLGDANAARQAFERSLEIDPNQPQVRAMLR